MAVFRVGKNENYTMMSNHHLKDKDLSLKAKGLLSQMLSLPDWLISTKKARMLSAQRSMNLRRPDISSESRKQMIQASFQEMNM